MKTIPLAAAALAALVGRLRRGGGPPGRRASRSAR